MDKWNQEKLPEVKDAQNIASDLFKIGACILGRQQKWLQCIIQMCSWLVTVEPQLQTVNVLIVGEVFCNSLENSLESARLARIYLSEGFGNCF